MQPNIDVRPPANVWYYHMLIVQNTFLLFFHNLTSGHVTSRETESDGWDNNWGIGEIFMYAQFETILN